MVGKVSASRAEIPSSSAGEGSILALAGGVGAARFLDGLTQVMSAENVCVVGNTADDTEIYGLHISPDLDTVMYTLAGLANPVHGWGIENDSFQGLAALGRLGEETWFQLGDRDLATHIFRTDRLRRGVALSTITAEMARGLGVRSKVLPMSNDFVRTIVQTPEGKLAFQTYFVRRRAQDEVLGVKFQGAKKSRPAPGVLRAIRDAAGIIFCPSNPIISVGPILQVPGIRKAIERRKCPSAAISPIVGGKALKGPAASMMQSLGMDVSALGIAKIYCGLVDILVLDKTDEDLAAAIQKLGMKTVVTNTIMSGAAEKKALARSVLRAIDGCRSSNGA
jgi:LPPG:FO 2-phospho-L-lactate transferase